MQEPPPPAALGREQRGKGRDQLPTPTHELPSLVLVVRGIPILGAVQGGAPEDGVEVRRYAPEDQGQVLGLLRACLGWGDDARYAEFFTWKHRGNPFGPSPAWIALVGGEVVGFRAFLRWELDHDGVRRSAVRAVDTATHADHRGRGIFTRLTLDALEELAADGVELVFNTPNDRSRPGYLKMGWQPARRPALLVRPRSAGSVLVAARARCPAERWSTPTSAGLAARDALADHGRVAALLESLPALGGASGVQTRRSPQYLAWRYGFEPLCYRAMLVADTVEDGLVIFRIRRRGAAKEAAICEVLVPAERRRDLGRRIVGLLRASGADYAIRVGGPGHVRHGFLPLPRQGPTLVCRAVGNARLPPIDAWRLALGDIELF